jgi:large subunit ribosomal protein L30
MAIKVKLVQSYASSPQDQCDTVHGLGLNKLNSEKLLRDTPAIRGMIAKVQHLVQWEVVEGDAPVRKRRTAKSKASAGKEG